MTSDFSQAQLTQTNYPQAATPTIQSPVAPPAPIQPEIQAVPQQFGPPQQDTFTQAPQQAQMPLNIYSPPAPMPPNQGIYYAPPAI